MPALVLASCAEAVKLWTFPDSSHIQHSPTKPTLSNRPHSHTVTGVHFNHNGTALLTCGDDGLLALQKTDGQLLCTLPAASAPAALPPLTCLAVTPGARYVCCGDVSGAVNVWDVKRQAVRWQLTHHTDEVTCIDLNAASSSTAAQLLLASGSVSSHILTHSLESGQVTSSLQLPSAAPVRCLQFSLHRSSLLAAGGDDGHPYLFDVATSAALASFSAAHSHNASLSALLFSPVHPSLLLSASLSSTLAFHDTSSRQLVQRISTGKGGITAADWSEDGNYIAVGLGEGTIELYDVRREGERVAEWRAHDGEVRSVRWQRTRTGSTVRVKDTPASTESRGRGSSTPMSVEAPSAAKRAALARDDVNVLREEESDGSYAPITPYVAHTKSFHSSTASDKPAASSSSASTVPSSSTSASSISSSLPTKVPAARAAVAAAAALSLPTSSNATDGDLLPPPMHPRPLPSSPTRDSIDASTVSRRGSPLSNRRSSYPAPAPFSSTLLNHSSTSNSSSVDSSRRHTLDHSLPSTLHPATNGSLAHTQPITSPARSNTTTAAAAQPATTASPISVAAGLDVSTVVSAVDGLLVRRLGELSVGVHEELVSLQVDVFRQFHVQSMEMSELAAQLREENRELREEMGRLREELTAYKAAGAAATWP